MTKRSSHLCQLQAREFDVHAAFHGQVSWQLLSVRTSWPRTVCPDLFLRQSRNCNKSHKLFSNKMIIYLLNGHFPVAYGLAGTRMSPFWILLEPRMNEVVVTTGAIRCAKLQWKCHLQQQTKTTFFTGQMPLLSPNQQCQSTEGNLRQNDYMQIIRYVHCAITI